MALRKAGSYSRRYARPYTRKSKVSKKSYIKTVPASKVVKLRMGDIRGFMDGKFKISLIGRTTQDIQLRDNAIEAARQYIHRFLTEKLGNNYYFEMKNYPHHILRENKMLTGAGADRMQTGMSNSFGATIGRAALIKKNQEVFIVAISDEKGEKIARDLINSARPKLACPVLVETVRRK